MWHLITTATMIIKGLWERLSLYCKAYEKEKKKISLAFELSNQSMKRISKGVYGSFKQDFPNLGYMLRIHISYLR